MTALKAIGFYILATIGFFLFWLWFFDKPNEHEILIPVLTAFFLPLQPKKFSKMDVKKLLLT